VGLDGALAALHTVCDVGHREIADVVEDDGAPLLVVEFAYQRPQSAVRKRIVRRFGPHHPQPCERSVLTATAAMHVGSAIESDPSHPCARFVETSHRGPSTLRLDECLLDDILGPCPVAEQGGDHRDEAAVLVAIEVFELLCPTLRGHRHNPHTPQTAIRLTSDHLSDPSRDPVT